MTIWFVMCPIGVGHERGPELSETDTRKIGRPSVVALHIKHLAMHGVDLLPATIAIDDVGARPSKERGVQGLGI